MTETQEPEEDPEPLPGHEEKAASICSSEGVYLKQLLHPAPPLQASGTRQSSPQERETEDFRLNSDASDSADTSNTSKNKNTWPLDNSYSSPAVQGCLRDFSIVAEMGNLPENEVLGEASPCRSEGKGLDGSGPEKPICPRGKTLQEAMLCIGPNATTPLCTDPGWMAGKVNQFSPLYMPGIEYSNSATQYSMSPSLQGLGSMMGGKSSGSQPQSFPPRGFQDNGPQPGLFPRYHPQQGMRYTYQPSSLPSYHPYQRTPHYTCPQGFSDWQRSLPSQRSPSGPPGSHPPCSLFPEKNVLSSLQGCETLNSALTPPTQMDAVTAKVVPPDGHNSGPEEEKMDESVERPESPQKF